MIQKNRCSAQGGSEFSAVFASAAVLASLAPQVSQAMHVCPKRPLHIIGICVASGVGVGIGVGIGMCIGAGAGADIDAMMAMVAMMA